MKFYLLVLFGVFGLLLAGCGGSGSGGSSGSGIEAGPGEVCNIVGPVSLSIENPSFEADAGLVGCLSGEPTGWATTATEGQCAQGSYGVTPSSSFPDGLPDGQGSAWLNSVGYLAQVLDDSLEENTQYTLSAFVGVRSGNGSSPHAYALQLFAGEVLLSEATGVITAVDHGSMIPIEVIYRSSNNESSGQLLEVRLVLDDGGPQLAFDLVELTSQCSDDIGPPPPPQPDNPFVGNYSGTFKGDDFGTWSMHVDANGVITGSGISDEDGDFDITGSTDDSGRTAAGVTGTDASWTGLFVGTTLSGTWINTTFRDTGTFSGELD